MGSDGMTYIPSLVKIGSDIQKLMLGHTDRQHGDSISPLLFFQNKESGQKVDSENFNWIELSQDMVHGDVLW
jgi:hypothetical protein